MMNTSSNINLIKENQLKDRFLAGNDEALGDLYRLYSKDLYALGLSLQVDTGLIEDAIHDIFEDIYRHKHRLKKVNNIKFYFFTAFRNRLFFLIKKEKNQKKKAEDYSKNELYQLGTPENLYPTEEYLKRDKIIKKVMTRLSCKQKEVIHYRFIEGMSINEISLLMEINDQSVKNLIYRTIKKIEAFKETQVF